MNVSRLFVQRPVATGLLMLAIVLTGLVGLRLLPLAALPEVDYPTIQVRTLYPGASADVMSRTVTAPLERQFGQMPGLQRMSSTSGAGISLVTLQFALSLPMDTAEQEVQAAMNAAGSLLPADLPAPPVYAKINPADAPILQLAVTSDSLPLPEVQNLVNTRLALRISQISGVGLVTLAGGQRPAVRVQGDVQALAGMGLGLDAISNAIRTANSSSAKGSLDGPLRQYSINANDQLLSADAYRRLVVAWVDGAPVRLSDVAQVVDGAENEQLAAWTGIKGEDSDAGQPAALQQAIIINVQRQPGANVIATVDAIKARLPELERSLPQSVRLDVLSDRTQGIRASVRHVGIELALAVVMVVLVIFAFLHSARATLIASVAVPISLIGALAVTYLLGYSLNNLSLMALTIATGFVVDDAIVMIENIARHRQMPMAAAADGDAAAEHAPGRIAGATPGAGAPAAPRKTPFVAALDGAREIGFTIVSLTVSLIAVLIPLLFMQDVIGRLFREFALTLAITIAVSMVVSLTLVPMLSARWLEAGETGQGRLSRRIQAALDRVIAAYDRGLRWVLRHETLTLLAALATLAVTALLYWGIPKGLFPTQSTGQIEVRLHADSDVSFARMARLQGAAARIILDDPAVQSLSSVVGVDAASNTRLSSGRLMVNLRRSGLFGGSEAAVMQRLREDVMHAVPGVAVFMQPTQELTIESESGPTEYRLDLEGASTQEVNAWAQRLAQKLAQLPELLNATTDAGTTGLAAMVDVDRDTAARLGVSSSALDNALYNAFGQRIVSTIFTETNQYRVILEAGGYAAMDLGQLRDLPVSTRNGEHAPLGSLARVHEQPTSQQVYRVGQYPAATVGFDTAAGVSLGAAVQAIRDAAADAGLPPSVTLHFTGAAGAYQQSLAGQLWLILAAVVCVYIVLGVLYESYVHPLTILSTLPSAGVGALLALWLTGHALDIIGIIGLVLLIGIVKKNAIIMIDFAIDAERDQGMAARDAIHQAALLRFRPILMTTLAALAAAVPLMLGMGEGAELRRPLGIAIFGGLILSQLLTLFTTPVIYLWFDRLGHWRRAPSGAGRAPVADGAAP